MSLKSENKHAVPNWISQLPLDTPESLKASNFPIVEILKNSLYYPACWLDGRPVQYLAGFVHSFIYVDYGIEQSTVQNAMKNKGFLGYTLVGQKHLTSEDFIVKDWSAFFPSENHEQYRSFNNLPGGLVRSPFSDWYIFDRNSNCGEEHGPSRFSLVYICGDGVATYQTLYSNRNAAPDILSIIQPGHNYGGNYTDFTDPQGLFARTVLENKRCPWPRYLVYGGNGEGYWESCWPKVYSKHVEWLHHAGGNGVWTRQ